jgi:hypothetical protein
LLKHFWLLSDEDFRNRPQALRYIPTSSSQFLPLVLLMSAFKIKKLYNSLQLAGRVSFVKQIAISGVLQLHVLTSHDFDERRL